MQGAWTTDLLAALLERTVKEGDRAQVDADYGRMLGLNGTTGDPAAGTIWRHLTESLLPSGSPDREPLDLIARRGCLARRLLDAAGSAPSHQRLKTVYARLADCLARNEPFVGRQD